MDFASYYTHIEIQGRIIKRKFSLVRRKVCAHLACCGGGPHLSVHCGIRVWVRVCAVKDGLIESLSRTVQMKLRNLAQLIEPPRTSRSLPHALDNAPISTRINDLLNYPDRCP